MDNEYVQHMLNILDLKNEALTHGNTNTIPVRCEHTNHFYVIAFLFAIPITLAFATTQPRKNLFLNVLQGRPGLIYPMDSLMRTSRLSYACAFSATTFVVYGIVTHHVTTTVNVGNKALQTLITILTVLIIGIMFYPLFCSLAIGSVFGYVVGSLYAWMLTGVEIYKLTECELTNRARTVLVVQALPSILCMLYLCVTLPIRVVVSFKKKRYFSWVHRDDCTDSLQDVHESFEGQYVKNKFHESQIQRQPTNTNGRIVTFILKMVHKLLYRRKRGFRYSSQVMSVMLVSLLIVYKFSVFILSTASFDYEDMMQTLWASSGACLEQEVKSNVLRLFTTLRNLCVLLFYFLYILRFCIIVSAVLAALLALVSGLHILSSYRSNLLELYKGDHSHIPSAREKSNSSVVVSYLKYAGFQVAYFLVGYSLHYLAILVITVLLGCIIALLVLSGREALILFLEYLWPVVLSYLIIAVSHFLLAKFAFLQDRGAYLALNNRRLFFNFNFFMFFYNILMGLRSCGSRIIKAWCILLIFFGRLNSSILPKRFEFLDPGFQAYVGFMHVEAAHTHPVMIVFVRLMLLGLEAKRNREAVRQGVKSLEDGGSSHSANGPSYSRLQVERGIQLSDIDLTEDDVQRRKRVAARFHWHMAFTLLHNPDIRVYRKGFMQILRQARSLGVTVPVSDRQGDIDVVALQRGIAKDKGQQTDPKGILGKDGRSNFNCAVSDVASHVLPPNGVNHERPENDDRNEQRLHIEFGNHGTSDSKNRQTRATENSSSSAITPAFSNPSWESFS